MPNPKSARTSRSEHGFPNVRVQAVINGQGVALMDDLVGDELVEGKLHRLSDYGYFIVRPDRAIASEPATVFSDWLQDAVSARNQEFDSMEQTAAKSREV